MHKLVHHLNRLEQTAWILVAVLLGMFLAFSYLFWQRVSFSF
jgi:hypothetical protein